MDIVTAKCAGLDVHKKTVLSNETPYEDLGPDYFERRHNDKESHTRRLVSQLEALGHNVTLEPKAAA